MLIGLLISVLCILASLTLYKSLVRVAADTKVDSSYDGQLAAAMLTVQMEVQNTGYGMTFKPGDFLKREEEKAVELLWRYKSGNDFTCRSLQELSEGADGSLKHHKLSLREATAGCTESSNLLSITAWKEISALGRWPVVKKVEEYLTQKTTVNKTLLDFSFVRTACSPFGALPPASRLILTVSAPSSALLNGTEVSPNEFTFCLPNTLVSSTTP